MSHFVLLSVAALLAHPTAGQLRVLSPHTLVSALPGGQGKVEGSTATFGAPFFGDRVLGRLVWTESKGDNYCSAGDYEIQPRLTSESEAFLSRGRDGSDADGKLIDIFVVRRGDCPFTRKVQVAQDKGAHAVIIVDQADSSYTQADMPRIIVADDGHGIGVRIPSILVPKEEGARLITAAKDEPVVAELKWNVPMDHVVQMDLWMSSGSRESLRFLKEFSQHRRALNRVVRFRPHYAVFSMPSPDSKLCLDDAGQYCAEDPDDVGPVTGRDVLIEDVRQLCIHEMTKQPRTTMLELQAGKPMVEFAQKYWDYIEAFINQCPLDGADPQHRFGTPCAEKVMESVDLDVNAIQHCIYSTQETKLSAEKRNVAWSPRALRINGWRYTGTLRAETVTRAVCSGFLSQPQECQELLDRFDAYMGAAVVEVQGVRMTTFAVVMALIVSISCFVGLMYKRSLKDRIQRDIREEVMLEVHQQMSHMGSYHKMPAHLSM